MSWIAMKMLVGDKAKFFGIIFGLTFAALLINQQGSIFCGLMCRTAGQIFDITGVDLWVMDGNVRYIDDVKPMIENNLYRVRGVDDIEWAVPLYKGNGRAKVNSYGQDRDYLTGKPRLDPKTGKPALVRHEVIEQVILLGLDDSSLVGAPPTSRIFAGVLSDLRKPDAVLIDNTRLAKLFPGEDLSQEPKPPGMKARALAALARLIPGSRSTAPSLEDQLFAKQKEFYARFVGRELEMNDHRAIVVGVCEATRTFQSNAVVYTTYSRAKQFIPQERKILSYVLVKVTGTECDRLTPAQAERVREEDEALISTQSFPRRTLARLFSRIDSDSARVARWKEILRKEAAARIASQTGLQARTSAEFTWDTIMYFFKYTGIPINFGITAMLGFLIGTAIAGQTFYLFTIDNLKQFGALKAMGTTNVRIVGMILLQATVVGLIGYGLGVGLAAMFGEMSRGGELAFFTPWQLLPITGVSILLICILASALSIRRVIVLEPAVVFRG
jgi:putative ABC transport system permease protein